MNITPESAAEMTAQCKNIDTDGSQWYAVLFRDGRDHVGYGTSLLAAVIAAHDRAKARAQTISQEPQSYAR